MYLELVGKNKVKKKKKKKKKKERKRHRGSMYQICTYIYLLTFTCLFSNSLMKQKFYLMFPLVFLLHESGMIMLVVLIFHSYSLNDVMII